MIQRVRGRNMRVLMDVRIIYFYYLSGARGSYDYFHAIGEIIGRRIFAPNNMGLYLSLDKVI